MFHQRSRIVYLSTVIGHVKIKSKYLTLPLSYKYDLRALMTNKLVSSKVSRVRENLQFEYEHRDIINIGATHCKLEITSALVVRMVRFVLIDDCLPRDWLFGIRLALHVAYASGILIKEMRHIEKR